MTKAATKGAGPANSPTRGSALTFFLPCVPGRKRSLSAHSFCTCLSPPLAAIATKPPAICRKHPAASFTLCNFEPNCQPWNPFEMCGTRQRADDNARSSTSRHGCGELRTDAKYGSAVFE
jgi:hypothetical protein